MITPAQRNASLAWLISQQKNGRFVSYTAKHPQVFNNARPTPAAFITYIIYQVIANLEPSTPRDTLLKHGTGYILSQQSQHGTWNYWDRSTIMPKQQQYPDDLDDTFHALTALSSIDPQNITGALFANITTLLTQQEVAPGGPYRTWYAPTTAVAWQDIDPIVNAAIARFLDINDIHLAPLTNYLTNSLKTNTFFSPYYPSPIFGYYLLSTLRNASITHILKDLVPRHSPQNILEIAISMCTYQNLGLPVPRDYSTQLNTHRLGNHWPAAALCFDPTQEQQHYYAGSPALTTAFALLATRPKFSMYVKPPTTPPHVRNFEKQLQQLLPPLNTPLLQMYHDWQARGFLPTITEPLDAISSLIHKLPPTLWSHAYAAQLYGWLAFTIMDTIWDENRQTTQLPSALYALRQCYHHLRKTSCSPHFLRAIDRTFSRMEHAASTELATRRIYVEDGYITLTPEHFGQASYTLAHQSGGHLLAPLGLLYATAIPIAYRQRILKIFTCLLSARQLNDDLHDWERDLTAGHLSFVVVTLLKDGAIVPGRYACKDLISQLQPVFWRITFKRFIRQLARYEQRATHHVAHLKAHGYTTSTLQSIVAKTQTTIRKLESDYTQAREFLAHYKPNL